MRKKLLIEWCMTQEKNYLNKTDLININQTKIKNKEILTKQIMSFGQIKSAIKSNMNKKNLLRKLRQMVAEFASVTTDKGILAWDGEEELKVGDAVFIEDSEGNRSTPEDGDYTTEDGRVIVVAGGKVTEIRDAGTPAPAPQEPAAAAAQPQEPAAAPAGRSSPCIALPAAESSAGPSCIGRCLPHAGR